MKVVFVLAIVGIVPMVFKGTDGKRLCWAGQSGPQGHMAKVQCYGSCSKRQVGDRVKYACWYQEYPNGCWMVSSMRVCFCNAPLCNTGGMPATSQQLSPRQDRYADLPKFKEVGNDNSKFRIFEE